MRLEYKVGVIVTVVVVLVGGWFFWTRDRTPTGPTAKGPEITQPEPSKAKPPEAVTKAPTMAVPGNTARQASPAAPPRPLVHTDVPRPFTPPVTTRPSMAAPLPGMTASADRTPPPGIRSETPLPPPEPIHRPSVDLPARAEAPTTRPAYRAEVPPLPPPSVSPPPERVAMEPLTANTAPRSPAAPTAAALPSPTAATGARTHVMKPGDTITGLATKYYGTGSSKHVNLILEANKHLGDPKRIPIGAKVTIPPAPAASPEAAPAVAGTGAPTTRPAVAARPSMERKQPKNSKPYRVKKGDTWRGLAAEYFGSESEWTQLFEMNRRYPGEPLHMLRVGETIYVPDGTTTPGEAPPSRALMGRSGTP